MIKIKESELHFSFVRSQGPGGQNVNKVSTAVQLRYNIHESDIPKHIKELFIEKYSNRISKNGDVTTIGRGGSDAIMSLYSFGTLPPSPIPPGITLICVSLFSDIKIPVKRIATKPSKASKIKRVESKKKRSLVKKSRKKVSLDD
jgi:ribosome-associated protein